VTASGHSSICKVEEGRKIGNFCAPAMSAFDPEQTESLRLGLILSREFCFTFRKLSLAAGGETGQP
jgi:hypothetical protein